RLVIPEVSVGGTEHAAVAERVQELATELRHTGAAPADRRESCRRQRSARREGRIRGGGEIDVKAIERPGRVDPRAQEGVRRAKRRRGQPVEVRGYERVA